VELRNHTPFAPFAFKSTNKDGRNFDVVAVKGTYDIVDDRRLKISQEPEAITFSDQYYGAVNVTSVWRAADLAAFKPRADVVVIGTSHAPRGAPSPTWLAEVRLGDVRKTLRVHGPRVWRRRMMAWSLSDPEPCTEVPIKYELAFGGIFDDGREKHVCEQNPVGAGFTTGRVPSGVDEIVAPRIEDARDPITELGKAYTPAGFGFIGRAWLPRRALAGTYDERWKREKWPLSPDDWDDAFYNAAHPDLTCRGYLSGGEPFSALAMTPSGAASFAVPTEKIDVRFRYRNGQIVRYETNLDTFIVDFRTSKVLTVFRARIPEAGDIRVVEILMRSE
jgi:hypothetical protein